MGEPQTVTIDRIGADGDGIAGLDDDSLAYLPYTLPGEEVRTGGLTKRGQGWTSSAEILAPSPFRQTAPCPHFGACGGCTLQHWQDAPYAEWKSAQVLAALVRAGFADVAMAPLARTPPHDRRRVDLALFRDGKTVAVGLHRHRGADVIDLHTCLVIEPKLVALIGALRQAMPGISGLRRTGSALANMLDSGIDLLLRTDALLSADDRLALADLAKQAGAARISWALGDGPPETASQLAPIVTNLAGAAVSPPTGTFLQASRAGAAAITAAVLAGLPATIASRGTVIELFAGCGTLTFALAERARVVAYEGNAAAYAALRSAITGRRIEAVHRDLARQPLMVKELAGAAAIVLDPPFVGAAAQMQAIAGSGVMRVIYVSCNPAALARDARVLRDAGYTLATATPVDQFLWSAAVESVCVFERERVKRR
ncbi:class I SAM-dependent RNA methyltransferase [Acidisphaera sp. L21]|uniref:class I SAM-dependent RNA methyltransferase n=1 Tax=Acidisphaera sp. L21 TaxID=1641851 RepID=UPI00131B1BFD|nr:class I SAM-dependent RNA methyltransferase [Acidisphaera sp. L21]